MTNTITRSKYVKPKKPPLGRLLRFKHSLEKVANVLDFGEWKHNNDDHWTELTLEDHKNAATRHLFTLTEKDDETGELHLYHLICRLLFLSELLEKNDIGYTSVLFTGFSVTSAAVDEEL